MRNRAWQSEPWYEPTDRDRYDYHRQHLMLADLDVRHRETFRRNKSSQFMRHTVEVQRKKVSFVRGILLNKVTHSTAVFMRNRAKQSEAGCEPADCDRYDYHR
jgi:hypothetical protein